MIPPVLAARFPEHVRQRGVAYWREGRVSAIHAAARRLNTVVRGSALYVVEIGVSARGTPALSCDCPYAEDHYACKHLWAALLAADERDLLRTLYGAAADHSGRGRPRTPAKSGGGNAGGSSPRPEWQRRLKELRQQARSAADVVERNAEFGVAATEEPLQQPLRYRFELDVFRSSGDVSIQVAKDARNSRFTDEQWLRSVVSQDRELAPLLIGARRRGPYEYGGAEPSRRFVIPPLMYATTLRRICETGRCAFASSDAHHERIVNWLGDAAWTPRFAVCRQPAGSGWRLHCALQRGTDEMRLEDIVAISAAGLLVRSTDISLVEARDAWPLVYALRRGGPLDVPADALFDLVAELMLLPGSPHIELPEGADIEQVHVEPQPHVMIRRGSRHAWDDSLEAHLSFSYDGQVIPALKSGAALIDRARRRIVRRMPERERAALARLIDLGAQPGRSWGSGGRHPRVAPRKLEPMVLTLAGEGWQVEADGQRYRVATRTEARVSSGIDWFELEGGATFGDQHAPLAGLLATLQRGEKVVKLDDGSFGILPEEWLRRYAGIAELGGGSAAEEGAIRFGRGQAALLDALLAEQTDIDVDAAFARVRTQLRTFEKITALEAPRAFRGELRPYQKDALGWMSFLRDLGFGGCLADDMGLGKTVQVLALLQQRRQQRAGPSLVVVPKSLVFNWQSEAARFTPRLRVRDYTGIGRHSEPLDSGGYDVLISTYGTLRRDAPELRTIEFDYVILDEAQAIKNAHTASAKAARLLRATHRLALTGTPIENSLDELWSLFEFLNPGMLGAARAFSALRRGPRSGAPDVDGHAVLARALRPFLLRRTKEQVAPELPSRTEQTLVVELQSEQRRFYDALRDRYRVELLGHVERVGIQRAKLRILEALLRLRQAAIHPALIDKSRSGASSAKLDVLLDTLGDVVAEGHRALVFSQFTTCLGLVRERLDQSGIRYEYLDGRTRDRQARVERFQNDPSCTVFLISLRAGGHGLNLTAADYVFLLDPWWNPAVEAQAIDRTHRIGQHKPVIALRLIARDTVEEKVIELQRSKRELADAILGADAGLITRITRQDLELLLA